MISGRAALALAVLAAAFAWGWTARGWREDEKALRDLKTVTKARDALAARLKMSDDAHASKLKEAENETNRLRDRVSAGPVRLLVAAKCPELPQAASAPGVDSGARAELDSEARSAYFALRDGINQTEAKLAACQAELTEITK